MANHYKLPFIAKVYYEAAAAHTDLEANKSHTDTLTQYLTPDVYGVKRGIFTEAMIYLESANARSFDLIISEGAHDDDQQQQAKFIFQSDETLLGSQGIADSTLETFHDYNKRFVLDTAGRIYFSLYSSAGAFGNTLGRLIIKGDAIF